MGGVGKILTLLLATALLLLGIKSLIEGISEESKANATSQWKTTNAVVIESRVNAGYASGAQTAADEAIRHSHPRSLKGLRRSIAGSIAGAWLVAVISGLPEESTRTVYKYEVNGTPYESSTYSADFYLSNQVERENFAKANSNGSKLVIYYDPSDPSRSVIHKGISTASRIMTLGIGLILTLISLLLGAAALFAKKGALPSVRAFDVLAGAAQFAVAGSLLFAGVNVMQQGSENHRLAEDSRKWPTADGIVTKSHVTKYFVSEGGTVESKPKEVNAFEYRYTVNEQPYQGKLITFEGGPGDPMFADQHPEGTAISVYYNPNNPEMAVLVPGHDGSAQKPTQQLGSGLLLGGLAVGIFAIIRTLSVMSRTKENRGKAKKVKSKG